LNSPLLVIDANVLIDYQSAGLEIIELMVRFVGPLHIPREVLAEVDGLDEETVQRMGAVIIETTTTELEEAEQEREQKPALSFPDAVCLVQARKRGCSCITNDRALRSRCTEADVNLIWGLEAVLLIHEAGGIAKDLALTYGERIQEANPFHITEEIMLRFRRRLKV